MWQYNYGYEMPSDDELKHYGVIGMKWGHRKSYTSNATKRYSNKADKYKSKGNSDKAKEYSNYAKKSQELDNKMYKNVKSGSSGKAAAKVLLNGLFGAKTYEVAKAAGSSRAGAEATTIVSALLGGPIGNIAANALIRSDYVRR